MRNARTLFPRTRPSYCLKRVLADRSRVLGSEHSATLISKHDLALVFWAQGDLVRARQLQEEVLEVRRRLLPPGDPSLTVSIGNLAFTVAKQGDFKKAETLREEIVEAQLTPAQQALVF